MVSNDVKLKRCPFCGGRPAKVILRGIGTMVDAGIRCDDCFAQITSLEKYDSAWSECKAVKKWNKRI